MKENEKTYGDLYKEFLEKFESTVGVEDYRPCVEMYGVPNIDSAIVMWLKDGTRVIYISNQEC